MRQRPATAPGAALALLLTASVLLAAPPVAAHGGGLTLRLKPRFTLSPVYTANASLEDTLANFTHTAQRTGWLIDMTWNVEGRRGTGLLFELHTHDGGQAYTRLLNSTGFTFTGTWQVPTNRTVWVYFENPSTFEQNVTFTFVERPPQEAIVLAAVVSAPVSLLFVRFLLAHRAPLDPLPDAAGERRADRRAPRPGAAGQPPREHRPESGPR